MPADGRARIRAALVAHPVLTCLFAGAALGVFVIHTTSVFAMEPGAIGRAGPTLAAAFSWGQFPLLVYHAVVGAIVGCGAGIVGTRAYRAQIEARERAARLEAQLVRAQKMESIGRLAAGAAHDFNNVLSAIGMSVYLARESAREGEDPSSYLDEAEQSVQRGAHLPRQLLAFARRQPTEPRVLDASLVVRDTETMVARLIGRDVKLETDVAPCIVRIDPGQVEQILVNLAVNARDAMPRGGTLRVSCRTRSLAREALPDPELSPGEYAEIAVSDTGTGIPPEILSRIFEPFFTTKAEGKGTGLGLATVYGIARQNGGGIAVESTVGVGTTFRVYLPVHAPPAEARVMLVEPDATIRDALASTLRAEGVVVAAVASPEEALVRAGPWLREGPFVVLVDATSPGVDAVGLRERLRVSFPALPVVLASDAPVAGAEVVPKPVTASALKAKFGIVA